MEAGDIGISAGKCEKQLRADIKRDDSRQILLFPCIIGIITTNTRNFHVIPANT